MRVVEYLGHDALAARGFCDLQGVLFDRALYLVAGEQMARSVSLSCTALVFQGPVATGALVASPHPDACGGCGDAYPFDVSPDAVTQLRPRGPTLRLVRAEGVS